jgi:hypothetical protein
LATAGNDPIFPASDYLHSINRRITQYPLSAKLGVDQISEYIVFATAALSNSDEQKI